MLKNAANTADLWVGSGKKEAFAVAKRGTILINTARGPIVDIDALYDAMKDGTVLAAGFDVLPEEPANVQRRLIAAWQKNEEWISHRVVLTIARVAEILGEDEGWLWDIANEMDPEDGQIWVYGQGNYEVIAFTDFGIDTLTGLIEIYKAHPDHLKPSADPE